MARGGTQTWQPIILVVVVAILGLYLFSNFFVKDTTTTDGSYKFQLPQGTCTQADVTSGAHGCIQVGATYDALDTVTLMAFKILIIGAVVLLAIVVAGKVGMPLSKKDAFTIILLGIAVWFLWDNVIVKVLTAADINNIAFSVGQKMGMFP